MVYQEFIHSKYNSCNLLIVLPFSQQVLVCGPFSCTQRYYHTQMKIIILFHHWNLYPRQCTSDTYLNVYFQNDIYTFNNENQNQRELGRPQGRHKLNSNVAHLGGVWSEFHFNTLYGVRVCSHWPIAIGAIDFYRHFAMCTAQFEKLRTENRTSN